MPLAYDEAGSGRPVVLIHGHPFDRSMWEPQLRRPPGGLRLIAPDLPGFGASPPGDRPLTIETFAGAVVELLDALAIERATVVGLSLGGLVAMELALARPDRVRGVVLAATTAAPVDDAERARRRAHAAQIEAEGMFRFTLEMAGKLLGAAGRRDPAITAPLLAMMAATPPAAAAAALRGRLRRRDYASLLPRLGPPALVVAGDEDPFAPEAVVEHLVAALPAPRVVRLPGVGHLPNLEAPEAFGAALSEFVSETG